MLLIMHPNIDEKSEAFQQTWTYLTTLPNIRVQKHIVEGKAQRLMEIYLIGNTAKIDKEIIEILPGVERVVRISEE